MTDGVKDHWGGELEYVVCCPICERLEHVVEYEGVRDCLEGVSGRWNVKKCLSCRCLYLDPRPSIETVGMAYGTYYTHEHARRAHANDNGNSIIWRLINGYLNSRYGANRVPALNFGARLIPLLFPLRQQLDFFMRKLSSKHGSLLDIGCGNGHFLLRAIEAGWNAIGLEPDPLAVEAARQSGVSVIQGAVESMDLGSIFDAITASHVIEHTHTPQEFSRKVFEHLRPGGILWLATPNADSIGRMWFGSDWRGLEPPRHMVVFSAQALQQLLTNIGFVDIRFWCRGRGADYILRSSADIAQLQGRKRKLPLPAFVVDVAASLYSTAAEELVITARRPG